MLALLVLPVVAPAQETFGPPLKRGFADGRFEDEYFGIVYKTEGLQASLPTSFLFTGHVASGVVVEVGLRESSEIMDRKQWLDDVERGWSGDGAQRSAIEAGVAAYAWVRFDQPDADGTVIHHGYALYPRGHQAFVVHAMVPRARASAVEAVTAALGGLRVSDRENTFRLAHVIARTTRSDPRAPQIISQAAAAYMEGGNRTLAFLAAARAEQIAMRLQKSGSLDRRTAWQLALDGGTIFSADGQHEQAVVYFRRCVALAAPLHDGPNAAAACRYQLSRSLAQLGQINGAFRALASALFGTEDTRAIARIREQARTEPDLEPLYADGRWKQLLP
jgi:tetratricopeptide (TPR) repeat protein